MPLSSAILYRHLRAGTRRSGGIGRRPGLKIPWEKSRAGSIPVSGTFTIDIAGWSSSVAHRAHNPKVVGSNPAPATIKPLKSRDFKGFF